MRICANFPLTVRDVSHTGPAGGFANSAMVLADTADQVRSEPAYGISGIILSFCAHATIELSLDSVWVQILVGATGVLLMTTSAYYWTWSKQRGRMLLSHA
jgi:hypothetical protein